MKITTELDVSGMVSPFRRPDLGPWLTEPARIDQWDILVTAKLDRITRSVVDLGDLTDFCTGHKKFYASVGESIDLNGAAGRMVANVIASVAQFERKRIAERRTDAAEGIREAAGFGGGWHVYGYKPDKKDGKGWKLELDPEPAKTVQLIAQKLIAGQSLGGVCIYLNDEAKIPSPRGKTWSRGGIGKMMRNPALNGYVMKDSEIVRGSDGVPLRRDVQVLDDNTWTALQEAMAKLSQSGSGRRQGASLLLRVAFCAR